MRKSYFFTILLFVFLSCNFTNAQKVYSSYLWHMDQPVYWADKSKDKPESKQFVEESQRLKLNGTNQYPGSNKSHPTNDLEEIFSKADRVQAYQSSPRDAINSIRDITNAGAQLSISGGLLDNIQSLGVKNQWGYSATWMNPYKEAIGWKTADGFPRLDVVSFTNDHVLSTLVSEKTLVKQIKAHQYISNKYYNYNSKGYWPAEAAFSERIIKSLVECGIEWSVVPNSHLARTLSDYIHPFNINGNIDAPNRADQVETTGINWYDGTIDGRGSRLAAPYCYQAHKAQYIDPATGVSYKIDIIPMCNYLSYVDGYSGANINDIATKIEPFSSSLKPSIVLLAHDGDNAWGGGSSYYNEAVTSFTHAAANAGYQPTTIQQFLNDHPVLEIDIVRVEDGAWVNAESDWGHPQFINWLWPLYSKPDYKFNPDGWTEDARNWAVITATENYVTMAEDLEGGNLRIDKIAEGGVSASDAEKAWHFYFGGLNSGFMYYGKAEDMEVKPSMTGNIAIEYAEKVINKYPQTDQTSPTVFIPQRFPYNPGSTGFGPTTSYKKVDYSSDFHVWTFAYDVSGLASVKLKYRTDFDGRNNILSIQNDTYAGGNEVSAWTEIEMNRQPMKADPIDDTELDFFILPKAKADLCYAEITNLKDTLVDYYVEATDTKGNIYKSPIQHVYIGTKTNTSGDISNENVSWTPLDPTLTDHIIITCKNATANSKLHWGVNDWQTALTAYQPIGTIPSTGGAVQTPFNNVDGNWQVELGPFNNIEQVVTKINFVIKHESTWDNNGGNDYSITIKGIITDNPLGQNINKTLNYNDLYQFSLTDFAFNSPKNNTFKAIKILSLPQTGILKLNGTQVEINQLISNLSQLTYQAATSNASFSFKIIDNADLESDAIYTASFKLINPNENQLTVSFLRPTDWGNTEVKIWSWNDTGNLFTAWPGVAMSEKENNWFSYTFDNTVKTTNIIFSKNGNPQTVDIMSITENTCFETDGLTNNKLKVRVVNCPTTSINPIESLLKVTVYPQPATDFFVIELPNLSSENIYQLSVHSLNGKELLSQDIVGPQAIVKCKQLKPGLYILRLISKDAKIQFSSKLTVK